MGGIDVGIGVLALLLVHAETKSTMLSALAFGIGFIAVTLAKSELFTENFLVPIAAVVARKSTVGALLRLWGGTMVMNLAGGWIMMWLTLGGLPRLAETAVEVARIYPELGLGWHALALALLGGAVITLMTWMERGTKSVPAKLIAAVSAAFLLAAAPLNHAIVVSLAMFAALHAGAPFGYADWLAVLAWASVGNLIGGVGLVTVLRLVQVGRGKVKEEQRTPTKSEREHADAAGPTE